MKQIQIIEPHSTNKKINTIKKLKVCAYCRVSSDSDKQLLSFSMQREYYENLIRNNNMWELVGIYADEGITGTKRDKRDEFNRMLEDCDEGKIDLIITKSVSRFARNTIETIEVIRKLKLMNIGVYFEKEKINTLSAESEIMLTILSSVAQEESISISKNQRWSYRKRFSKGTWKPSNLSYGYTKDSNGEIIIKKQEEDVIKIIFDKYLEGKGAYRITRELNELNYVPRKGNEWSISTVKDIINNEIYVGDLLMQKTYMSDTFPYKQYRNRGEKQKYIIKNNHQSYLTAKQIERIEQIKEYRKNTNVDKYKNKYELSGIMKCKCGGTLKRQKRNSTNGEYIQWVCVNHIKDKNACEMKAINQEKIEKVILKMWDKLKVNYQYILLPIIDELKNNKNEGVKEEINTKINELIEQSHILSRLLSKGYIDSAIFIEKTNIIKSQLVEVKANKKKINELEFRNEIKLTREIIKILTESSQCNFNIIKQIAMLSEEKIEITLINGLKLYELIQRRKI